jgi:hypothetical protein
MDSNKPIAVCRAHLLVIVEIISHLSTYFQNLPQALPMRLPSPNNFVPLRPLPFSKLRRLIPNVFNWPLIQARNYYICNCGARKSPNPLNRSCFSAEFCFKLMMSIPEMWPLEKSSTHVTCLFDVVFFSSFFFFSLFSFLF